MKECLSIILLKTYILLKIYKYMEAKIHRGIFYNVG